jgi:hypothetical protein
MPSRQNQGPCKQYIDRVDTWQPDTVAESETPVSLSHLLPVLGFNPFLIFFLKKKETKKMHF